MAAARVVLALLLSAATAPQTVLLKITVTITAADGSPRPVPRHALLISDDPVTTSPHRFVTKNDGTIEAYLRPGNYVVESDDPFVFEGNAYEWTQPVTVSASGGTVLALTAANATVEAAKPGASADKSAAAIEDSVEDTLLDDLHASVVTIWTPRSTGRGFLVDARGLIAVSRKVIGPAASVEVQLSTTKKVAGVVLPGDPGSAVAVVWIDPHAIAPAKPIALASAQTAKAAAALRDEVLSIGAVRVDDVRAALDAAGTKLGPAPPVPTPLPVEPEKSFPEDALQRAAKSLGPKASAYVVSAADFDVVVITPPVLYASMHKPDDGHFDYGGGDAAQAVPALRALEDFGAWNEYVSDTPPVVLIRVTPKVAERFWTTVARGAAQTQGVAIPAIKKPKAAFGGLSLACGGADVAPIHPFRIEHRVDDGTSIDEGLYVFPPSAISPACGTVTITVFADKAPDKGDARTLDPKIVQQVWDDFGPFRMAK